MKVSVDGTKCEGHALCAGIAPTVFEVNADDLAVVIEESPQEAVLSEVRSAASACPTMAIVLDED
ncbi:ferredoxin [Nocardia sp. JW2]|uniref:ferredoxin n=1 Tax=Nocardia TaxID=1817 RepID=UPI0015EF126C|nr:MULTISPECIES: ferredoxin [Nocardia]MCA2207825.1 ferredoxin [Nocardia rosealba]